MTGVGNSTSCPPSCCSADRTCVWIYSTNITLSFLYAALHGPGASQPDFTHPHTLKHAPKPQRQTRANNIPLYTHWSAGLRTGSYHRQDCFKSQLRLNGEQTETSADTAESSVSKERATYEQENVSCPRVIIVTKLKLNQ